MISHIDVALSFSEGIEGKNTSMTVLHTVYSSSSSPTELHSFSPYMLHSYIVVSASLHPRLYLMSSSPCVSLMVWKQPVENTYSHYSDYSPPNDSFVTQNCQFLLLIYVLIKLLPVTLGKYLQLIIYCS